MASDPRSLNAKPNYLAPIVERPADDGILMGRIALGDEQALMTIYDRYSPLVFRLSLHVVRDHQLAEDVVQEVFLRLWRTAKGYDQKRGSLAVWITVVARHLAIDHLRRRRREAQLPDTVTTIHPLQLNTPTRLEAIDIRKIRSLLATLSQQQREALELSYFGGLTCTEIADRLDEPVGTVKSRIRLGLQTIRRLLLFPKAEKRENS